MAVDKDEIFRLSNEEKRRLAFELLDGIDEEFFSHSLPEWKKKLIQERIELDKKKPSDVVSWSEVRKKYYRQ